MPLYSKRAAESQNAPDKRSPPETSSPNERTSPLGRPVRVLLVDDSRASLGFVKAHLAKLDCEFVDAEEGTGAFRLAKLMPFDVVIADVNMPGMNGLTLLRALRTSAHPRLHTLPVVLLTADRDPNVREAGLTAGAQELVYKPVDGNVLVPMIERLLGASEG